MGKHWLFDATAGPLELSSLRIDLTIEDLMADLDPRWQAEAEAPVPAPAAA